MDLSGEKHETLPFAKSILPSTNVTRENRDTGRLIEVNLSPNNLEAIATRVAELINQCDQRPTQELAKEAVRLVDAATLARLFDVNRDWVYAHAKELGAIRLGGEKGRLRFDLEAVRSRLDPGEADTPHPPRRRTRGPQVRRYNGSTRKRSGVS